jgi:hypothetical protein
MFSRVARMVMVAGVLMAGVAAVLNNSPLFVVGLFAALFGLGLVMTAWAIR